MPPPLLIDLSRVDLSKRHAASDQIYQLLPHRHEFQLLSGLCHLDTTTGKMVAFADIQPGDWWVRGHVPGRPLLPGVLMLEMAAQASAVAAKLSGTCDGFIAYGGVDQCKFRDTVVPPARLYLLVSGVDQRPRRIVSDVQGVVAGKLVFEARITGMALPG